MSTRPRDPETGKFLPGGSVEQYEDIEVVSFTADFGVEAANLDGTTAFSGGQGGSIQGHTLVDYDDIVDRNERLVLLGAWHHLIAWINSTQTADGTVRAIAEIGASPSQSMSVVINSGAATGETGGDLGPNIVGASDNDDSIDILGRRLKAVGYGPITDGATGVGGAGSAGRDEVVFHGPPGVMAEFHPRDELFTNIFLEHYNVDDAGIHLDLEGQHWYGVVED